MTQIPKMIERRMMFGVREDVKDGLFYLDDSNIVWVAGKSLVLLDTQLSTQQLIPCSPTCESVTAMALSVNRRVLAVAEGGKSVAIVIYIYDPSTSPRLRRKKVLQLADLGSNEYVSMCFSQDGKQLVALGGFPEWNVVLWNVERMKMTACCPALENALAVKDRHHLRQCSISPHQGNLICVTGHGVVAFFQLTDNHLFPAPGGVVEEGTDYLAHIWIPTEEGRLIVSTGNGDLLLFQDQEYKFALPLSPSDGLSINAMIAYSKGFVCGGDLGLITIYERTESTEMYRKVRTFRFSERNDEDGGGAGAVATSTVAPATTPAAGPLSSSEIPVILAFTLTLPPAEEYLAFLTSTKQLYCLNLPNADFTKAEDMVFQPVGQPFHSGPITSVDVCAQRPFIVTAGRDRNVVLWNSLTNTVELRKRFSSEITSVAIHPSGLHLLVGFADALKLYNIYDKDLFECKAIGIRGCTACSFSTGGQFFAAMHSTTIHVYYTYTCELLGHLRGHSGKVRSLYFVPPDDTRLISTGTDGAVYEFSICDFHKVNDHVLKAVTYNYAVADVGTVWAAGNDRKLRQLDRAKLLPTAEYDLVNSSMASMAISKRLKLLFGGCEDGTVRVFNTYLGEKLHSHEKDGGDTSTGGRSITIETHPTHAGPVTKLALSHDESMMVSVGDDGVVVFWDVVAPHRNAAKEAEYSSEILMDRRDLENAARMVAALTNHVAELRQRMVQQQIKRERVHEEQIAKLEREYSDEMAKQRKEIDELESAKNEQAIRFTEYMTEQESTAQQVLKQTDNDYVAKIGLLRGRAEQLQRLIDEQRSDFEAKKAALNATAERERAAEEMRQQAALQALEDEQTALRLQREQRDTMTQKRCALMEEENDVDINKQKEHYEKRRREQEAEVATLQTANQALLAKENVTRAEMESRLADVKERLRQQGALEAQIDGARRDIEALTNELRERGETIAEKDRRVYELKKKNQELEKFKFVLEYKIKELKAQIDPRDEEIRKATEKLICMENEAEQYKKSNENLILQIRNLRQKRAGQQKELDSLAAKMQAAEEFQARMWTELSDVYEERDTPRELKRLAKVLLEKYTSTHDRTHSSLTSRTATDEVREYHRERDHLERNLASLKRKVAKDAENNRADKSRIIAENVILVKEINELRKDARTLAAKAGVQRRGRATVTSVYEEEYARELEVQRAEMNRLRKLAHRLEAELTAKGIPLPTSSAS